MTRIPFLLLAMAAMLTLYGCPKNTSNRDHSSKHDNISKEAPSNSKNTNTWQDQAYKLNVIYFVPKDVDTVPGYTHRLSEILLDFQNYTANYMEKEGFGKLSFGLDLKDATQVNITTIYAKQGKDVYPYNGGGSAVIRELNAYFSENPEEKRSEHSLIIMPSISGDPLNPGGVPFYGMGTLCFALDYPEMKLEHLGTLGAYGALVTKWIGGLYHELGHGLNAPHNSFDGCGQLHVWHKSNLYYRTYRGNLCQ